MKNYITLEQFLAQPSHFQETLMDWWKPQQGDLYYGIQNKALEVMQDVNYTPTTERWLKHMIIPLLQMHHLIQFIEEQTDGKLDIIYNSNGCYFIRINSDRFKAVFEEGLENYTFEDATQQPLLEVLWDLSIEVIKHNL